jgi:hypothetical protein
MSDTISDRRGVRALICAPDGAKLASERDALDLMGQTFGQDVELVVVPVERLDPAFFTLSTRIAGEMLQKFIN